MKNIYTLLVPIMITAAASLGGCNSSTEPDPTPEPPLAAEASVKVTEGKFFLHCSANAQTRDGSDHAEDQIHVSLPDTMTYSQTITATALSEFEDTFTGEILKAKGFAATELDISSELDGSDQLKSMTIMMIGSARTILEGKAAPGSSTGGTGATVEFKFEVVGDPVLAAVTVVVEKASFFIRNSDAIKVINTFGDHQAVLEPGEYFFQAKTAHESITSQAIDLPTKEFETSIEGTLTFVEVPSGG